MIRQAIFPMFIAYDMKLWKIGCALMQPIYGGTIDTFNLSAFGTENWQLAPTDNMKVYQVNSQEELDKIVELTKQKRREQNESAKNANH